MKTVFINGSPKKRFCASAYFLFLQRLFVGGKKVTMKLRTPADHEAILKELDDAQAVVFALPLYVDGVPSHVLRFLEKMEAYCKAKGLRLNVYCIANNGFIEGKQNEPLMQTFENFCARAGHAWGGGVGIGGGVMLNVERIMITVMFGLMLLEVLFSVVHGENVLDPVLSFGRSLLGLVVLACGIIAFGIRLAVHINRGTDAGKKYTRIMLPSFVFIIFADIFFVIISVLQGGIFRGWFKAFKPDAGCSIITGNSK